MMRKTPMWAHSNHGKHQRWHREDVPMTTRWPENWWNLDDLKLEWEKWCRGPGRREGRRKKWSKPFQPWFFSIASIFPHSHFRVVPSPLKWAARWTEKESGEGEWWWLGQKSRQEKWSNPSMDMKNWWKMWPKHILSQPNFSLKK